MKNPTFYQWYDTYYTSRPSSFGFASIGGVTYFLTDSFGIRLDGAYYGYGGFTVSVVFKL